MNDLVERYLHQVGRYLPQPERDEVEAELRSLIQDHLDDRYGPTPTAAEVAAVLSDLGEPRQIAASYGSQQYLVGPDLYPTMLAVLRFGWLRVPAVVVVLNVIGALIDRQGDTVFGLFFETLAATLAASAIFTAVVVLVFAIMQRSGVELKRSAAPFDPLALPPTDDPFSIDRFEVSVALAFGLFVAMIWLYFLRVGGLTLRFNLSDPGAVIPVAAGWLVLLLLAGGLQLALHGVALWRGRWTIGLWLGQLIFELVGVVGMYGALVRPLYDYLLNDYPKLADVPLIGATPGVILASGLLITLFNEGTTLLKMWFYTQRQALTPHPST